MKPMNYILLIMVSALLIACSAGDAESDKKNSDLLIEKESSLLNPPPFENAVSAARYFIQAVIDKDEANFNAIKHPKPKSSLSGDYTMTDYRENLRSKIGSVDDLDFTLQTGDHAECVVVSSNNDKLNGMNLPEIHHRLTFTNAENREGLYLFGLDTHYGMFNDKGCKE